MKMLIKSALNQVKAETDLKNTTKQALERNRNIYAKEGVGWHMKKIVLAACAFILLCGLSIGGYFYYRTPVNYLSLDINPSVELGVNAFDRVVSATGYNGDGKTILEGQNLINCSVNDAVKNLVISATKNGFINSDGSTIISLTAETDNPETASTLEENSEQGAQEATDSEHVTAVVFKTSVALARREEARKLGITPGKLNLIQKLQALDATATVEEYKDAKVTDIMKKVIELNKSLKNSSSDSLDSDLNNVDHAVSQAEKNQKQGMGKKTGQGQEQKSKNNSVSSGSDSSSSQNGSLPVSSTAGDESSGISSQNPSSEVDSDQNPASSPNKNTSHGSASLPQNAQSGKKSSTGQGNEKSTDKKR